MDGICYHMQIKIILPWSKAQSPNSATEKMDDKMQLDVSKYHKILYVELPSILAKGIGKT